MAYARPCTSDEARAAAYQDRTHQYNQDRPHSGINGQRPIERVHNLNGSYILTTSERRLVGGAMKVWTEGDNSKAAVLAQLVAISPASSIGDGCVSSP